MESIIAVGLAANILQFVSFAHSVFRGAQEIYSKGTTQTDLDLEDSVSKTKEYVSRIKIAVPEIDKTHPALYQLATECETVASDFITSMSKVKVDKQPPQEQLPTQAPQDPPQCKRSSDMKFIHKMNKKLDVRNRITSVAKAIHSKWEKPEIDKRVLALDRLRRRIDAELLQTLVRLSGNQEEAITNNHNVTKDLLRDQKETIMKNQDATESLLASQREAIRKNQAVTEHLIRDQGSHISFIVKAITELMENAKDNCDKPTTPSMLTKVESAILVALSFGQMNDRRADVHQAHEDTCSYIYENPKKDHEPWHNFRDWLETKTGIYWIGGKPGSGKSTLMKFIGSNKRTKHALDKWAGSDELIVASHFFWRAATDELQRNQEGLFRALLHTILSRRRDLIAHVLPDQYETLINKYTSNGPQAIEDPLSVNRAVLKEALFKLAKLKLSGVKIFLLIDGLDEYIADQTTDAVKDQKDLVDTFKEVTRSCPSIKAVVSSRPDAPFDSAFSTTPQLQVQHLTYDGIRKYVNSKLMTHPYLQNYEPKTLGNILVESIIEKASGVFLWVALVARSLHEGLDRGKHLSDLQKIVTGYPKDIQELYKHMFERMDESDRADAFRLFRAISLAKKIESQIPSALCLSFIDEEPSDSLSLTKRFLYLNVLRSPEHSLGIEELQKRLKLFEARLRSHCCGFFEVKFPDRSRSQQSSAAEEGRVEYMHRTVSEFLDDQDFREIIQRGLKETDFQILQRLAASVIFAFKRWRLSHVHKDSDWREIANNIQTFFRYCQQCESMEQASMTHYIEELDMSLTKFWQNKAKETRKINYGYSLGNYGRHWAESIMSELRLKTDAKPETDALLSLASRFDVTNYVCYKLEVPTTIAKGSPDTGNRSLVLRSTSAVSMSSAQQSSYHIVEKTRDLSLKVDVVEHKLPTAPEETTAQETLSSLSKSLDEQMQSASAKTSSRLTSQKKQLEIWERLNHIFIEQGIEIGRNINISKGPRIGYIARSILKPVRLSNAGEDQLETYYSQLEHSHESSTSAADENRKPKRSDQKRKTPDGYSPNDSQGHCDNASPSSLRGLKKSQSKSSKTSFQVTMNMQALKNAPESPTAGRPCRRCNAVEKLRNFERFDLADIIKAVDNDGGSYDVPALCQNLMNVQRQRTISQPLVVEAKPRSVSRSNSVPSTATENHKPSTKMWSRVVSNARSQDIQNAQGDFEFVKKTKHKRGKGKGKSVQPPSTYTEEVFEIGGGIFNWSLTSHDGSRETTFLTAEQARQLKELVLSFKA